MELTREEAPNQDGLVVKTLVDPETRRCSIWETYKDIKTQLTPDAARTRAQQIFSAAGVAEACAAIMKLMVFEVEGKKGFGKPTKAQCQKAATEAGKFVNLVRSEVKSIPEGIELAYGFKLDEQQVFPSIVLFWNGGKTNVRIDLEQARSHALYLLEIAESVQSDNFLHHFMDEELKMPFEEVQPILHEFSLFRQRNQLEEIKTEPTAERLARAMEATGDRSLAGMIQKARDYWYDDYKSELALPIVQLVEDLRSLGHEELAQRVINGEFDGTPEESAAWFEAEGKDFLPQSMWKQFGYDKDA